MKPLSGTSLGLNVDFFLPLRPWGPTRCCVGMIPLPCPLLIPFLPRWVWERARQSEAKERHRQSLGNARRKVCLQPVIWCNLGDLLGAMWKCLFPLGFAILSPGWGLLPARLQSPFSVAWVFLEDGGDSGSASTSSPKALNHIPSCLVSFLPAG